MEKKKADNRLRRYIRIEKESQWELIDKLMTLSEYKKSFNKVIADALDFGLPLLFKSYFEVVEDTTAEHTERKTIRKIDGLNEDIFFQIVKLLKEVILNATINKSILCSLFEAKSLELNHERVNAKKFTDGAFRDTPDYLASYELRALRDLRK